MYNGGNPKKGRKMQDKDISMWKKTYNVHVYESDQRARAKLTSLCNYFQNSAWEHYNAINMQRGPFLTVRQIWLMTRMEIEFSRFPQWDEDIEAVTWSRGIDRMLAFRDFNMTGEKGDEIARGSTTWVVIDIETGKIQRLDEMSKKWPSLPDNKAIGKSADKIETLQKPEYGPAFKAKYSDLDVNMHVNNVKYIEWALDSYPLEIIDTREIKKIQVNFEGETKLGDEVEVGSEKISDEPLIFLNNVLRKKDHKEVCRIKIEWK
jgi:acyl-ACP thioesterase